MRLKSVHIDEYKNLKDFTLAFEGTSFIDVFVGKNGSGKSNLFEALIEIFRHIYEYDKEKGGLGFSYSIKYEIDGIEKSIAWDLSQFKIDGAIRKTIGKTPLPDNLLIYYSGHNSTVAGLVEQYEIAFRRRIKKAELEETRRFIGIGPEYKSLLLSVLLMQSADSSARRFLCQKLGIRIVSPELKLVFQRPSYATDARFDIEDIVDDRYWKAKGITKSFLDQLSGCISPSVGSPLRSEGYFKAEDRYILYFDIGKIQANFSDVTAQELFRQFDNLKTLGMLAEISIQLTLENGLDGNISTFSDGQFQSVYIYSIIELFKGRNCLTLLDEPDSFLHPEWQFEFLKQVFEITGAAATGNHVLMSSHSASTLVSLDDQNINLLRIDGTKVSCSKRTKRDVINELSNNWIQYSEDESKLLIDNVIRSSIRPILFVEGPSDVSILNTAYMKLYPGTDIPILIQDAFDRGFIKVLLSRDDVCRAYPEKHFFALFDFDDAYDDWRDLGGEHQVTDIRLGLCRKLQDKNVHSFLLPIPDNQLKAQVWDEANPIEKIKSNPHFCVEHIFWGNPQLEQWYRADEKSGVIKFKGDRHKVKFAKEVVPTLDAVCFEAFRPMFEFIRSKCQLT